MITQSFLRSLDSLRDSPIHGSLRESKYNAYCNIFLSFTYNSRLPVLKGKRAGV